ncbi:MAG: hypothetical protein QOC99_552, partial [Acidobacteriota bacterium]|nr:hypothetical protein [Acidobacteriota bacterium]
MLSSIRLLMWYVPPPKPKDCAHTSAHTVEV